LNYIRIIFLQLQDNRDCKNM